MARKKKSEDLELELELEPTELDDSNEAEMEVSDDDVSFSEAADGLEAASDGKEEEPQAAVKPKPRKQRSPRKKAVSEVKSEASSAEITAPVDTVLPTSATPAAAAGPEVTPVITKESANDRAAAEQIAALVKQWEQSNAALAQQLEKLNQKIPSPTMKAATSWAPLARIAVGASAASVLLAVLSLVFSHSVRQQVLQSASVAVPALHRSEPTLAAAPVMPTGVANSVANPALSRPAPQDIALEQLIPKARREQADLAFAKKKPRPQAKPAKAAAHRRKK